MSKLIKNEFIKLFKKKSIYIILLVTLAFIIFSNFMYKSNNYADYSEYTKSSLKYYEEDLKKLNPKNPGDFTMYIDLKSQVDMLKLMDKYGFSSWQATVIPEYLFDSIRDMNVYEYSTEKNKDMYNKAKKEYNDVIKKLDTDDWKFFVSSSLDEINKQIQEQEKALKNTVDKSQIATINQTIFSLKLDKQLDEWRLEKDINFNDGYLNKALEKYSDASLAVYAYENSSNSDYMDKIEYYDNLETAKVNKYYIENNIKIENPNDNRGILLDLFTNYELFILIFVIMIAGSIVSDEFNKGTIKLLLVRPYSRVKILFSKFIVCVSVLLLFILFITASQYICGGIIQGFDTMSIPAVVYNHDINAIQTMSVFQYLSLEALAKLPIYLLLMTLAFAFSTLFTNSAIAITLPLLGYMASSLINQLALAYNIKPLLYFVTPNWDLSTYMFGGLSVFEGLTLPFSIAICVAYFIIMLIPTFIVFKKRNIKNI